MGRFAEAIKDFWEGVGGFLSLGSRDLANRFEILARGIQVRRFNKSIVSLLVKLGRTAWEHRVSDAGTFPVIAKIESLQREVSKKKQAVDDVKARIEELQEQRRNHVTLYQKKISEQLKLKQPVDAEKTNLLVETKRLRRELTATQDEIGQLAKKLELQQGRLEELKGLEGEQGREYLRSEMRQEIEFNERSRSLKEEKVGFLEGILGEHTRRVEKVGKVLDEYERQIAELRRSQQEGTAQIDSSIRRLDDSRHQIEREIRRLAREMSPLFGDLGMELRSRNFEEACLQPVYAELNSLELDREEQLKVIAKRRSESASIGLGIKIGFYGMISAVLFLLVWMFAVLL